MIYVTNYNSLLGELTLACDETGLVGVWLVGQKYYKQGISCRTTENTAHPILMKASKWLNDYFMGKKANIKDIPLTPIGSEFRQRVWQVLCEIPYGETITYGEVAKRIANITGKQKVSAQAVGGAVGHNPISIIIPCHRVVGINGSLTGYAGGLDIKEKLLSFERVDLSKLFRPTKGTAL
jgi:methylated-DNA-[protein]-cysteine S-methyltransferase